MKKRSAYAPSRPRPTIDWAAVDRERDIIRAQEAAAKEQAAQAMEAARQEQDPFSQLVKRCYDIEQAALADRETIKELGERFDTLTTLLKDKGLV